VTLTSQLAEAPVQRKASDGAATGGVHLPSNAHAYDMVDVDLTRFEEETARLKAIAVPQ